MRKKKRYEAEKKVQKKLSPIFRNLEGWRRIDGLDDHESSDYGCEAAFPRLFWRERKGYKRYKYVSFFFGEYSCFWPQNQSNSYFDLCQKHEKTSPQNKLFSRLVLTGTILPTCRKGERTSNPRTTNNCRTIYSEGTRIRSVISVHKAKGANCVGKVDALLEAALLDFIWHR